MNLPTRPSADARGSAGNEGGADLAMRIRGRLLPIAEAGLARAMAVQQHLSTVRAAPALAAIGERAATSARALETMVRERLDELRAQSTPGAAAHRRMRHDLRNPVAAVRGFAELLVEDQASQRDARLNELAQDLLETADETLLVIDAVLQLPSDPPAAPAPLPEVERLVGQTGRVLVVDDNESMRALLIQQLRRDGHDAVGAAGGEEALRMMRESEYDVVLLDLHMPGIDGYEVLKRIAGDPRLRETRVIMVSSAGEDEGTVRCIEAGAIDYLVKPVKPVLLRARLAATLARKRWRDADRHYHERLEAEKRKSDSLLLNILPRQMVLRLSAGEDVIADAYDDVTVLFTDFVGFTRFASRLAPRQVVETLNRIFSAFDNLVLRLNVEKIKMIGDAYMAVAGLPAPRLDHVEAIADLALGMQQTLGQINPTLVDPLDMRIGIASGPVVAGVIGTHKFSFDVWGHTVNMAARHESYCEPGRIHVATESAARLVDKFNLRSRGIMNIRGRGEVETFYLLGRK